MVLRWSCGPFVGDLRPGGFEKGNRERACPAKWGSCLALRKSITGWSSGPVLDDLRPGDNQVPGCPQAYATLRSLQALTAAIEKPWLNGLWQESPFGAWTRLGLGGDGGEGALGQQTGKNLSQRKGH
eukprot:1159348-Pelagomonas_calceolata.AAC.7